MSDGPGPQVRVVGEPSPPVGVLRTARDAMAAQWPRLTDQQINWLERNWAAPWTDAVLDLWSRRRNGPPMTTPMPDPENPNQAILPTGELGIPIVRISQIANPEAPTREELTQAINNGTIIGWAPQLRTLRDRERDDD